MGIPEVIPWTFLFCKVYKILKISRVDSALGILVFFSKEKLEIALHGPGGPSFVTL